MFMNPKTQQNEADRKTQATVSKFMLALAASIESSLKDETKEMEEFGQIIKEVAKPRHENDKDSEAQKEEKRKTALEELKKIKKMIKNNKKHGLVFELTNSLEKIINLNPKWSVRFNFEDVQFFGKINTFSQALTHTQDPTPTITSMINFLIKKIEIANGTKSNNAISSRLEAIDLTAGYIQDSTEKTTEFDAKTLDEKLHNYLDNLPDFEDDDTEEEKEKQNIVAMIENETDPVKKLELIKKHFPELHQQIIQEQRRKNTALPEMEQGRKKKKAKAPGEEEKEEQKKRFGPQPGGFNP